MNRELFFISIALVATGTVAPEIEARPSAIERKALRKAKGTYNGIFRGTVGNPYNAAGTYLLKPKYQKRQTKGVLDIPVGHTVKFVKLTTVVRAGGNIVRFTGGRVLGKGLLPLGIEIRRGRTRSGTVNLRRGRPRITNRMALGGVDLTNANAPVSGQPVFKGAK